MQKNFFGIFILFNFRSLISFVAARRSTIRLNDTLKQLLEVNRISLPLRFGRRRKKSGAAKRELRTGRTDPRRRARSRKIGERREPTDLLVKCDRDCYNIINIKILN